MARRFSLDDESEAIIAAAVKTGRYQTPDDVLRAGLDLLKRREAAIARLRAEVQKGIDAADRGEVIDLDEAFDWLDLMIDGMAEKAA